MADYLDASRFPWAFFVDCQLFSLDNSGFAAQSRNNNVYMRLPEQVLHGYLQPDHLGQSPRTLATT